MQKKLFHKELGNVLVTYKTNARRFIARWKVDHLSVTAPAIASDADVVAALNRLLPQLLAAKNKDTQFVRYHENQQIDLDGLTITIIRQDFRPDAIFIKQNSDDADAFISVGNSFDFDKIETSQMISKGMKSIAKRNAASILIHRARNLADIHDCNPVTWEISTGIRTLGQCNADRRIKLSYMLVFLPCELRDYIICHELAHLTEMNHSPRFHQLCDKYLGGREKEMIARLKNFHWPLLRK